MAPESKGRIPIRVHSSCISCFLSLDWEFQFQKYALPRKWHPHSSTLAWKIPWAEEPGRLQSVGLLRVRHDWATSLSLFTFMYWKRKWQPTPVFLPGDTGEPGGLPSMGSHRVRHVLAAAARKQTYWNCKTNWIANFKWKGHFFIWGVLFGIF